MYNLFSNKSSFNFLRDSKSLRDLLRSPLDPRICSIELLIVVICSCRRPIDLLLEVIVEEFIDFDYEMSGGFSTPLATDLSLMSLKKFFHVKIKMIL